MRRQTVELKVMFRAPAEKPHARRAQRDQVQIAASRNAVDALPEASDFAVRGVLVAPEFAGFMNHDAPGQTAPTRVFFERFLHEQRSVLGRQMRRACRA